MDEADKSRVLDWLYDRNKIQRVSCESAAGKRDVIEQDVSGGVAALLRHLRSGGPFDPEIMMKLAEVLDPLGASTLHVGKRLRRGRGAPRKADTVRDAVRLVFRGPSPIQPRRGVEARYRKEPPDFRRGDETEKGDKKGNPGGKQQAPLDILSTPKT
jgi:hypothetical protein